MAIQTLNTIKTWFKTGLKPSQQQFWDTWDSFRHKFEKVPLKDIENLEQTLSEKAEKSEFDNHLTNANAHSELFLAKEDKANKGIANGYAPLDEFSKIASKYLTIVNNLITNSETSLLSAQQGVVLQNQINGINTLLQSDNVNLDTLQEIVNAVKEIELSLNTILVNDLTTGGVTKALTAEMGKLLQSSKEDKSQKGVSGGYAPLNNFTKLASQYLDIVNDLVSGGSTSLLSAEQGKILQNQINVINTLLSSDNIDLDTLQEIVDAIENVQGYLNTFLVNDLTAGGTDKALTAQMGKNLNEIKANLSGAAFTGAVSGIDPVNGNEFVTKQFAEGLLIGVVRFIAYYNPNDFSNQYPSSEGSGTGGAIRKGDTWVVSGLGVGIITTIGTKVVQDGDRVSAMANTPAQDETKWSIGEANIGYTPANDTLVVHKATPENITGVKTFTVSPLVPTATAGTNNTTAASTAFVLANSIQGIGTSSFLPKFTGVNILGNSLLSDDGIGEVRIRTAANSSYGFFNKSSTDLSLGSFFPGVGFQDVSIYNAGGINNTIFKANGNVGIGDNFPSRKLSVLLRGTSGGIDFGVQIGKTNIADNNGSAIGLLFSTEAGGSDFGKVGIAHERTASFARGGLHFLINNVANGSLPTLSDSKMYIDINGNIGIGTVTPFSKLGVKSNLPFGTAGTTNDFQIGDASLTNIFAPNQGFFINQTQDNSTNGKFNLGVGDSGNHLYDLGINAGGAERITLLRTGYVGIGVNNPIFKLDVSGADGDGFRYSGLSGVQSVLGVSSTAAQIGTLSNHKLDLMVGATERVSILTNGNVGVGISSPSFKLDVNGVLRFGDTSKGVLSYGTNLITLEGQSANTSISLLPSGTGNVLINTTTDDGVNKLQVNGNIITKTGGFTSSTFLDIVSNADMTLWTNAVQRVTVKINGNVGIGTTAPTQKLEVNGGLKASTIESSLSKDITSTDLNNLNTVGFFKGSLLTNAPNNSSEFWYIINEVHAAGWDKQTASSFGGTANIIVGGTTYIRVKSDGVWGVWQQVVFLT